MLAFASDAEFDVVVCPLVMHYIKDWLPVFREFHRVLKPSGSLVFSTHHPFMDWKTFEKEDYFACELLEDEFEHVGPVTFYRRPLSSMSLDLWAAGFVVDRLVEPQPAPEFEKVNPGRYRYLLTNPGFLVFKAVKAPG